MSPQPIQYKFNRDKAIEVILYIANSIPDPTYDSISKLLYFADKTSLERYARFISGDTYYAMQNGPVPSNTYDLMKEAPSGGEFGFCIENNRQVIPLRKPDLDELSDSDIECLDVAIELYGNAPFWKKTQDSHDKAWEEAWENRKDRLSSPMSVESIVHLLEDAEDLLEHLETLHDE